MSSLQFQNDLDRLVAVLPDKVRKYVSYAQMEDVIEIVLDIGRTPEVRHSGGRIEYLGEEVVTEEDISYITQRIQDFTSDNRSGIPGTLHRISAIRNRQGKVIGLTCRIGRVVTGTIACIKDICMMGKSILFLGRPGVGKTTKLREISRLVADELGKRVVVVDTSNEIAGDGDTPHPAIGHARRMQVSQPLDQAGEGGHGAAEGFADLCERRAPLGPVADESQDVGLHHRDLLLVQGAVDQPLRLHTDLAKAVGQPGVIDLLHRYSPP